MESLIKERKERAFWEGKGWVGIWGSEYPEETEESIRSTAVQGDGSRESSWRGQRVSLTDLFRFGPPHCWWRQDLDKL